MKRGIERKLVILLGIWQIIDGLITIFYYGLYKYGYQLNTLSDKNEFTDTLQSSLFTVTNTFGILLISLGLINLLISKRYLKDNQISRKIGVFLIIQSLFSYIIFDLISVIFGMSSAVIILAKNKSIKKNIVLKTGD